MTARALGPMLRAMPNAASLQLGESGVVGEVDGTDGISMRLLEMGLVPGTSITLLKRAPGGDPLQFRVRGFHLSVRRAEADRVTLESSS